MKVHAAMAIVAVAGTMMVVGLVPLLLLLLLDPLLIGSWSKASVALLFLSMWACQV